MTPKQRKRNRSVFLRRMKWSEEGPDHTSLMTFRERRLVYFGSSALERYFNRFCKSRLRRLELKALTRQGKIRGARR